jgi:hypothetical protein
MPAARRHARRAVLAVAFIAIAILWVRVAVRPSTDLLNHQEFGRRFLAGEALYRGGLNYPYPPAWAAGNAPLALLPASVVTAVLFPLGLMSLVAVLFVLHHLSSKALPLPPGAAFWVATAAVALSARFLIRDLLDGGPNLVLMAMVWGALYALSRQWDWTSAWLLGAAVALKLTAGIFVAILLALGRPRQALGALACAIVLCLLPALRMGPTDYATHVSYWFNRVSAGVMSEDPSVGVLGPEPDRNLSLRAAVGRLVPATAPESRRTAAWVATGTIVLLSVGVLIVLRRRGWQRPIDLCIAWAAGNVLALLVSPITWRAHAVALLPACYLLIRTWIAERRLHRAGLVGLAAIAVPAIVLARGIAGERASVWSDRWSITTAAVACLLAGVVAWPRR